MKVVELPTGTKLTAEIAATPSQREQGLMNRKELSSNHSMILSYPEPAERAVWMKNTHIPLDIIFLSEDKKILNIEEGEPHNTENIWSDGDAQYVLEVNQGLAEENNLQPGDFISF